MMSQFLLNGLIAGFIYALIALSFCLIYNPTKFFHFTHGAVFAWGAYFGFIGHVVLKWPIWAVISLSSGMCALLGMILEVLIYGPMRRHGATGLVLLLTSLGLYVVLQNSISLAFGDETKSLRGADILEGIAVLGARITPIQMWTMLASTTCFLGVIVLLKFTKFGRALRAVTSDPELAQVDGIDADRIIMGAFALGSALAGLAALLIALDTDMTPTMGLNALMMGMVAMIVGGLRSLQGTLLGGLLLGLVQHLSVWKIGSEWQDAIAFTILMIFLLVRPHGILGKPLQRAHV